MTYAPATISALGAYWVSKGGTNLGIVGDAAHASRGVSYHLGKDQLDTSAYSIQTARDKTGLTNAASAIDLGRLDGTLVALRAFSTWLVAQARANVPGTSDLREIIYSPDGVKVLRWDRERGYASEPRTGEADDSHIGHSHISFYRDSEVRDKVALFRGYFEEADMLAVTGTVAVTVDIPVGRQLYALDGKTPVVKVSNVVGALSPFASGANRAVVITTGGQTQLLIARTVDCVIHPIKPACDAEVAAAVAPLAAKLAAIKTAGGF